MIAENKEPADPDVADEQMIYITKVVLILSTTGHRCPPWGMIQDVMRLCIKCKEAGCTVEEAAKKACEELRI